MKNPNSCEWLPLDKKKTTGARKVLQMIYNNMWCYLLRGYRSVTLF